MSAFFAWYTVDQHATVTAAQLDAAVQRYGLRFTTQEINAAQAFRMATRDDAIYELPGIPRIRLHFTKQPGASEGMDSPVVIRQLTRTHYSSISPERISRADTVAVLTFHKAPVNRLDVRLASRFRQHEDWRKMQRFLDDIETRHGELLTVRDAHMIRRLAADYLRQKGAVVTAKNGAWLVAGDEAATVAAGFHEMLTGFGAKVFVVKVDLEDPLSREIVDRYAGAGAQTGGAQ